MGYKRAEWHSGLTYEQTCPQCNTIVRYKDDKLDFRPWFADGFVYCPNCNKPLRHHENLAVGQAQPVVVDMTETSPALTKFCASCGAHFAPTDRFCGKCGAKRE